MDVHIIKRDGERESERFDRDKLHSSIRAACLSVRSPEGEAEMVATKVCDAVVQWLRLRPEVTSSDLRRKATQTLQIHHPEAAYLYKHHRLVI
ncbi:ATP cone domain-containing protein [Streptomyces caniscabiei]|uniref:ATP cone domain-containing protein n=1 Tax=Streptomyces caniscabiei TaxID=2746961 RepID=UPI0029A9BDE7|nr:ATP cone domain-containing protein [Streptomyces caniscabiei]MDX2776486.1 ATP cone domain-containing protein [Streptomyces caniscabiei]